MTPEALVGDGYDLGLLWSHDNEDWALANAGLGGTVGWRPCRQQGTGVVKRAWELRLCRGEGQRILECACVRMVMIGRT